MSFPRYERYKDSGIEWLGEVPKHWQHASLRHACRRITDGSHFSPKSVEDGKSYVTVRNLDCGKIDLLGAAKVSPEDFEQLEKAGCRPAINDVLFSKDGTVGKVAIVEDDNFVALSSLAIISPEFGKLAPKFLFYFLQSANGEKQIESLYAGAALRRITLDAIVGIWLPLPELPEQQTIAAFLDRETAKIDVLIAEQQRLIELLKEKRQTVISHAVTKGLNPNAPMKDSGIEWLGEVPKHWDVTRLGFLCKKIGSGKTPLGGSETYIDSGVVFIRSQNVYDEGLRLDDVVYISEQTDSEMYWSRVNSGDILLNITGASLGRTCLVPDNFEPANVNQHVCIIRLIEAELGSYIAMVMKSSCLKAQIDAAQTGAAREGLNFGVISKLTFALPPISEQQNIAAFLDHETAKLEALTTESKTAITLLQERRTALISAAVIGKIDVRGLVSASSPEVEQAA